jgi:hypothetical protein
MKHKPATTLFRLSNPQCARLPQGDAHIERRMQRRVNPPTRSRMNGADMPPRMQRPPFTANATRKRKAQTTGVRIKDGRDGFAIDPAHDSVWFRVPHFSFWCQAGAADSRQHDADETKAKHMPTNFGRLALAATRPKAAARATNASVRKRRQRLKKRPSCATYPQSHERPSDGAGVRVDY